LIGLVQLVQTGMHELADMAKSGKLAPSDLWVAIKGGSASFKSILAGDVAGDDVQEARASICASCPAGVSRSVLVKDKDGNDITATATYCGEPFRPTARTCGCMVLVRVNGQTYAAGKTKVGSESCPKHKWESSSRT
jgi:hypothetical protein